MAINAFLVLSLHSRFPQGEGEKSSSLMQV